MGKKGLPQQQVCLLCFRFDQEICHCTKEALLSQTRRDNVYPLSLLGLWARYGGLSEEVHFAVASLYIADVYVAQQ